MPPDISPTSVSETVTPAVSSSWLLEALKYILHASITFTGRPSHERTRHETTRLRQYPCLHADRPPTTPSSGSADRVRSVDNGAEHAGPADEPPGSTSPRRLRPDPGG